MNINLREKVVRILERVVELLVEKSYSEVASLTKNRRLTEIQISEAITEYGRILVRPPHSFDEHIDIIPVIGSKPQRWSIDFPLWTLEEGESDLSVEITCIDNGTDEFDIELDNIHVF